MNLINLFIEYTHFTFASTEEMLKVKSGNLIERLRGDGNGPKGYFLNIIKRIIFLQRILAVFERVEHWIVIFWQWGLFCVNSLFYYCRNF